MIHEEVVSLLVDNMTGTGLGVMTNAELQTAIEVLLKHAGKQKKRWWGSLGNDDAGGAFSDCLARMLYEQAKRAGCWPDHP